MAASGSDKDNNPKESSERVRIAAEISLNACQTTADLPPEPPEKAPGEAKKEVAVEEARIRPRIRPIPMTEPPIQPASFMARPTGVVQNMEPPVRLPTGQRGLVDLIRRNLGNDEPPR